MSQLSEARQSFPSVAALICVNPIAASQLQMPVRSVMLSSASALGEGGALPALHQPVQSPQNRECLAVYVELCKIPDQVF